MRLLTTPADANPSSSKLSLSLATTPEEVREVQRLRYKVFIETMNLSALANAEGLDKDEFDDYCDHLIVRDNKTLSVVGTYRVMSPHAARRMGKFYSEQEFDLSRLDNIRNVICEAGRACIHPDYRSGAVIMLLWAGIADFMRRERCDYLMGCASVSLADGRCITPSAKTTWRRKSTASRRTPPSRSKNAKPATSRKCRRCCAATCAAAHGFAANRPGILISTPPISSCCCPWPSWMAATPATT